MNRREYMNSLEKEISSMSYSEVKDILAEINEHFDEGIAEGRTEEEIAQGLGTPWDLGKSYMEGTPNPVTRKVTAQQGSETVSEKKSTVGAILFVIFFNLLVGLPVWTSLLGFVMGMVGVEIGFAGAVIGIFATVAFWGPFMTTGVLMGITIALLAVTFFAVVYFAVKYFIVGTISYIKWNAKLCKEGF